MKASVSSPQSRERIGPKLGLYRALIGSAGATYLLWWFFVEWFLPGAFNPLASRLAVVTYCWLVLAATYVLPIVRRQAPRWLLSCGSLITLHYFYLFHFNQADINWVFGSYITIIATVACLHTEGLYLSYAALVLLCSVAICVQDRALLQTIFIPGTLTTLVFGYVSLRARLRLLRRSLESTQWFQNLFDAVFEAIVVHEEGVIVDANEAFPAMFGYEREEVIGAPITQFVAPEFRASMMTQLEASSELPYELQGLRKDRTRIPVEIRGKAHRLRGRALRLAAISDVTARKKSELNRVLYESSQAAVRMRDEFLSIASHELKTPLTNIKLQTQMAVRSLRRGDASILAPERMRNFIEQTDRQADRLARLVEEMLDVSRISSGSIAIEWEDFDLAELVREVAGTFAGSLGQSGSTLQLDLPAAAPVCADRFRLEQVVSNLLSNSIKYGNRKPIRIAVDQSPTETRLLFEDQGIGIAPENHARIFDRFERGISSTKITGLGLGLYISRYIVQALGGSIELTSELDQGACFTVVLPREIGP